MIRLRQLYLLGLWLAVGPARADIISYLRFEEGSGVYASDETGLMNGALLGGWSTSDPDGGGAGYSGWSTSVPGSIVPLTGAANSGSLYFAGGGEYVNLSNANSLDLGTSFTIEFYFRPEDLSVPNGLLSLSPVSSLGVSMGTTPSGTYAFASSFQGQLSIAPANLVVLDQWHHYALVKQPGGYSIYIDGQLQYSSSLPSGTDGPYSFFGTDIAGDRELGENFRGYIDEFRISDAALTPDQFLNAVPESSTLVLISLGLLGVCGRRLVRAAGR